MPNDDTTWVGASSKATNKDWEATANELLFTRFILEWAYIF